jgi:hypothetical protein
MLWLLLFMMSYCSRKWNYWSTGPSQCKNRGIMLISEFDPAGQGIGANDAPTLGFIQGRVWHVSIQP